MTNKTPLILILTFFTLTIIGGIFYFQNKAAMNASFNVGQKPLIQPIQPQPVTSQSTTPQVQPASSQNPKGWKTYENKEFGFAFDYPGEWKVEERASKVNWGSKEQKKNILVDVRYIDFYDLANEKRNEDGIIFGMELTKYPTDEVKKEFDKSLRVASLKNTIIISGALKGILTESLIGPEGWFQIGNTTLDFTTPDRSGLLQRILYTFRFFK